MANEYEVKVDIDCIVTHNAAIAIAKAYDIYPFSLSSECVEASGTSVRHPDDRFDKGVAKNLAIGRALENLGNKLQKRANGVVKQNEDNEARKARQQAEAAKILSGNSSRKRGRRG